MRDLTKMSTISFYLLTYVTGKDLPTSTPKQLPSVQPCSSSDVNFYHSPCLKLMPFTEAFNSMQVVTLIQREQGSRGSGKAPCYLSVEKVMETACNTSKLTGVLKTYFLAILPILQTQTHTRKPCQNSFPMQCKTLLPNKNYVFLCSGFPPLSPRQYHLIWHNRA